MRYVFLLGTTYDDSAGLVQKFLPWIGRPGYWLKHAISNGEMNANVGAHQLVKMLLFFSRYCLLYPSAIHVRRPTFFGNISPGSVHDSR